MDLTPIKTGSNPGENVLFVQTLPAFHPVWTCHVYVKLDVRESTLVLEVTGTVSVVLIIIIIIRLYIVINELQRDVKPIQSCNYVQCTSVYIIIDASF